MLYDVFICHAFEDKESLVRPLAEVLRSENVAVWYDEFTLVLGDSIRRSLDRGLNQSRFGVVVLSHAFFSKNWPQYELDALVEREMMGQDTVVLPVWHAVTHEDVMAYSPSLAGKKAVSSDDGLYKVANAILEVVHPQHSPLIIARDALIEWGVTSPVITDEYWLQVVEASNRVPGFGAMVPEASAWGRWSFPLPEKEGSPEAWGERLAWTAMQMNWVKTADEVPITPLTPPDEVLQFVYSHSGLLEMCQTFPDLTAEYTPQLTIPGMGGDLEPLFEEEYQKSLTEHEAMRRAKSVQGSGLTINSACPLCDEQWALRSPTLGDYQSVHVAHDYFSGGQFGPQVSPYASMDHAVWLLSEASNWIPKGIHNHLLDGIAELISWRWDGLRSGEVHGADWSSRGALLERMSNCICKSIRFTWTPKAKDDALNRIRLAAETLHLCESPDELFKRFVQDMFPQSYIAAEKDIRRKLSEWNHGNRALGPKVKKATDSIEG